MNKYIYAVGVHEEGGLKVLNNFLNEDSGNTVYFLDSRLPKIKNKNYLYCSQFLFLRLIHIIYLSLTLNKNDHIVFLNGLPPIIRMKCEVSVMFQNANLFRDFYQINFFKWFFSKDAIRYLVFQLNKNSVDNWYVFSVISAKILNNFIKIYVNLKVIDIYDEFQNVEKRLNEEKFQYDFIYPASYLAHKNHDLLFESLIELSKEKIFPKVLLTIKDSYYTKLKIEKLKKDYDIKISNIYFKDNAKFLKIYKECKCLLYLSKSETIGLPLLEAYKYDLVIISPKLKYTTQFIQPDFQFDLNSKKSLKKIIKECFLEKNLVLKIKKNFIRIENSINIHNFLNKVI